MPYSTIDICFWLTLVVGLPGGVALYVLWLKKVWPALMRSLEGEKRIDLDSIAMKSLVFGFPGLVMMILAAVPVIYFGHLKKQFDYCVQVVKTNEGIERDDEFLRERCAKYEVEELFREAGK